MSLDYADRCERYARQRGWTYDPQRLSIDHLTPGQKRRALKKEGQQLGRYTRRAAEWHGRRAAIRAARQGIARP